MTCKIIKWNIERKKLEINILHNKDNTNKGLQNLMNPPLLN